MIIDTGVSGSVSDFYFEGGQLTSEARGHLFAPYIIFVKTHLPITLPPEAKFYREMPTIYISP